MGEARRVLRKTDHGGIDGVRLMAEHSSSCGLDKGRRGLLGRDIPRRNGERDIEGGVWGVREGRPWNHLIGDFASRPSIHWRYRIGSGRLRQVMATARSTDSLPRVGGEG